MPQDHFLLLHDHASRSMGIEVDRVGEGYARIRMVLREDMLNGFGMAHGGMVFALADTCFALASNDPAGPDDTITVGAGADIAFIASARRGQVLVAEGSLRALAGRSGIYDVRVTADDVLIAEFRGRSRTIPHRPQRDDPPTETAPYAGPRTGSETEPGDAAAPGVSTAPGVPTVPEAAGTP